MTTNTELRSWTTPGAQESARATYASVKYALERSPTVTEFDVDVFLQGSYANHTNTRGDSDVDIVVMMRSSYQPDLSRLGPQALSRYNAARRPAATTVEGLRAAVHAALRSHYGEHRVHPKNKCIRVDRRDGYVDADVVPCMQYRLFTDYPTYGEPAFIEGVQITPLRGSRIVNYPKEHLKNGNAKNGRAMQRYKPTVRQVKRLRRSAVNAGLLQSADAPGYLLECLTYNAPDSLFVADDAARLRSILNWLHGFTAQQLSAQMKSCDEVHFLFRDDPGQHNQYTAERVIDMLWRHL